MRHIFLICLISFFSRATFGQLTKSAPVLRARLGMTMINFSVGEVYKDEPLGAMMTLNPQVLWDLPTFRSRVGVHYMGDFASSFGLIPISGVGLIGYFYPFGLSTAYEIGQDATLIQKSKAGPYAFIALTPVNLNINTDAETSVNALAFSAFMLETMLGAGYDYPLSTNMIVAMDIQYRFASAQERETSQSISYSGMGLMLTFSTSYH